MKSYQTVPQCGRYKWRNIMNAIFLLKSKNSLDYLYDDNTLRQGLEKMRVHGYTAIPVITRDGSYAGCINEGDFLWHILSTGNGDIKALESVRVRDILRKNWNPAVRVDVEMDELLERAMNQNFVPVVDDRNSFIGIITRKSIIWYFAAKQKDDEVETQYFLDSFVK